MYNGLKILFLEEFFDFVIFLKSYIYFLFFPLKGNLL